MGTEMLKVSVTGTTNTSGLFYTNYSIDDIDIIGAYSHARVVLPFISGTYMWGIGMYTGSPEGLSPVVNSVETATIFYIRK